MAQDAVQRLHEGNVPRYRLKLSEFQAWKVRRNKLLRFLGGVWTITLERLHCCNGSILKEEILRRIFLWNIRGGGRLFRPLQAGFSRGIICWVEEQERPHRRGHPQQLDKE